MEGEDDGRHLSNEEKHALDAEVWQLLAPLLAGLDERFRASGRCQSCQNRPAVSALVQHLAWFLAKQLADAEPVEVHAALFQLERLVEEAFHMARESMRAQQAVSRRRIVDDDEPAGRVM